MGTSSVPFFTRELSATYKQFNVTESKISSLTLIHPSFSANQMLYLVVLVKQQGLCGLGEP